MKISNQVLFSKRALKELSGGLLGGREIAKRLDIAPSYANWLLNQLKVGGLIESVRGPTGGYKLTKPHARITLLDLLTAIDGGIFPDEENDSPFLHDERERLRKLFVKLAKATKLEDL